MNIVNRSFLKLALLPKGIYKKMGVYIPHLTSILQIKLTKDDRRPSSLLQSRTNKKQKPVNLATIGTMVVSTLLGLFYLMSFSVGSDKVTQLSFYFSMFFFMLSATLISEFTSVLIDIRDNFIILPRPENDRTIVVARLLHIFIHICKIVAPMSLPGFIYMIYATGWGALVFLLLIWFVTLFSIFFINAVYILILKLTTPRKFQSIISSIQIVFAIVVYGSYQLFPRLIGELHMEDFSISSKPGIVYYPLYWLASSWKILYTWNGTTSEVITGLLALLLPFASLFLVIRYLAPSFNNKLALINSSVSESAPAVVKINSIQKRKSYAEMLARIFTKGHTEAMGFLFTWKMSARSRDFKLKVYPGIGYMLVLVAVMLMNHKHTSLNEIAEQSSSGKVLIVSALYFSSFLLNMAVNQMTYSDKYKASWIYYIAPITQPGAVISGAAKAIIFKFYIPLVSFITIAGTAIAGPSILPNIILGLFNQLLIASLTIYINYRVFPFSLHQNNSMKTGSFVRSIGVLSLVLLIGIGHYLIYNITSVVIICALLSILATYLVMSSIKNTTWEAVKSRYNEE